MHHTGLLQDPGKNQPQTDQGTSPLLARKCHADCWGQGDIIGLTNATVAPWLLGGHFPIEFEACSNSMKRHAWYCNPLKTHG